MSTQIKLILPLIEGLSKEDFDTSSGFVNAYIYDKNRPHLTSNLFLLYETKNRDYKKAKVMDKLQHLPSLYMWETIKINGEFYTLYSISLVGSKMKKLLNGIPSYDKNDIKSTLSFWGLNEEDVNKILFGEDPLLCTDFTSVPEEDYTIPDITTSYGYKESLAINKDSQAFFVKNNITEYYKNNFPLFFLLQMFFLFQFFLSRIFLFAKTFFFRNSNFVQTSIA